MSDTAAAGELFAKAAKACLLLPPVLPSVPREGKGVQSESAVLGEAGCRGWAILPKEKDRPLPGRQFKGSLGGKGGETSSKRRVYLSKLLK